MYEIRMGVPEMSDLWNGLYTRNKDGTASKSDQALYRKLGKALKLLSDNPRHPGLQTHEITELTKRYGQKVWQSYLENATPKAGRIYWVYAPGKGQITIIGLEPHPDDKSNAYKKIQLSSVEY